MSFRGDFIDQNGQPIIPTPEFYRELLQLQGTSCAVVVKNPAHYIGCNVVGEDANIGVYIGWGHQGSTIDKVQFQPEDVTHVEIIISSEWASAQIAYVTNDADSYMFFNIPTTLIKSIYEAIETKDAGLLLRSLFNDVELAKASEDAKRELKWQQDRIKYLEGL